MLQYSQNKGTEQAFQSTGSGAAGAVQGLRETTGNSRKDKKREEKKMTITIGGYEVEIKAKYTANGQIDSRMNKADTMDVLSLISIWAREAGYRYDALGMQTFKKGARAAADSIYEELDKAGYYK